MEKRIDRNEAEALFAETRAAARLLAGKTGDERNRALGTIKESLTSSRGSILDANAADVAEARAAGTRESLLDRLALSDKRMKGMVDALDTIAALPDPLGRSLKGWTMPNGIQVEKRSVPLGTIAMIYESRPNVTLDAAALAVKSGNGIVLRGGSSAYRSNRAISDAIRDGLKAAGIPEAAVVLYPSTHRDDTVHLLRARGFIDLIIPRGGAGLIRHVTENATVPSIETGVGNCHLFVDADADIEKAYAILENGKIQRPGVCNALETLLVHRDVAGEFLPFAAERLNGKVEMRGCERSRAITPMAEAMIEDWETEYLDFILAVKVVDGVDEAVEHIRTYGTYHSEAIVTGNMVNAERFRREVDASAVYVNASTRFTDGEMFGFGAEIGISTQKVHARGPMALEELVTHKYLLTGEGQIR